MPTTGATVFSAFAECTQITTATTSAVLLSLYNPDSGCAGDMLYTRGAFGLPPRATQSCDVIAGSKLVQCTASAVCYILPRAKTMNICRKYLQVRWLSLV